MVSPQHEAIERQLQHIDYLDALHAYYSSPRPRVEAYARMLVARSHRAHSKAYASGAIFDRGFIERATSLAETRNALVALALVSAVASSSSSAARFASAPGKTGRHAPAAAAAPLLRFQPRNRRRQQLRSEIGL